MVVLVEELHVLFVKNFGIHAVLQLPLFKLREFVHLLNLLGADAAQEVRQADYSPDIELIYLRRDDPAEGLVLHADGSKLGHIDGI